MEDTVMSNCGQTADGASAEYSKGPAKRSMDAPAQTDIDAASCTFYEGVTISSLDDDEFEDFWTALAAKNRRHFVVGSEFEAEQEEQPSHVLSIGGFDASSLLPGFGLVALDIPQEQTEKKLKKLFDGRLCDREIYRQTLTFCATQREFSEVEEAIQSFPEFASASQTPYRYLKSLIDCGALKRISIDDEGNEVTAERVVGLTEDEIDDMIVRFDLLTSEPGKKAAEEISPERRLRDLVEKFPDRVSVYQDLLSHVKSHPCNYAEIEQLFAGRDFSNLRTIGMEKHVALKPSVFVNNMEKAGGLVWKEGRWHVTREGEELIAKLIS